MATAARFPDIRSATAANFCRNQFQSVDRWGRIVDNWRFLHSLNEDACSRSTVGRPLYLLAYELCAGLSAWHKPTSLLYQSDR